MDWSNSEIWIGLKPLINWAASDSPDHRHLAEGGDGGGEQHNNITTQQHAPPPPRCRCLLFLLHGVALCCSVVVLLCCYLFVPVCSLNLEVMYSHS